ncbi:MAG: permease-like cell division protein FtsX [Bacillota bacterium]|nr:permease-like cell division protein FtsX [Bacillota bacterium]
MRIFKIISDAVINMWRNKATTFFALISVTASLIILGMMFAMVLNINSVATSAKTQFDTIVSYIDESYSDAQVSQLVSKIMKIQGVKDIKYESKDEALRNLKERWGNKAYLLEGLEQNPLPRSLIIYLTDIVYSESVVKAVTGIQGVEEVRSYQDIVNQLLIITDAIRRTGSIFIFILIGVSVILINNAISMAVASRAKEISIMKFVGATDWFIRWPFFVEGMLIGLFGAGISYLVVVYSYRYVFELVQEKFFVIVSSHLVLPDYIKGDIFYLFIVIGVSIGALGAILSTRKPLNT